MKTILLFGAPGSGKGTQGRILAEVPGIFYFASGDAFRALQDGDPLAEKFREYSKNFQNLNVNCMLVIWFISSVKWESKPNFVVAGRTLSL